MLHKNLNIRVDEKMAELIQQAARAQGRTVSNYIRHVVARAVIIDLASESSVEDRDNGNDTDA